MGKPQMNGLKGPWEEREADVRVWTTCQSFTIVYVVLKRAQFYYKEQRQSGSFQKKWDQGFFFPLKMSYLLFFFPRQETEQLVFTKLGMIREPSQK